MKKYVLRRLSWTSLIIAVLFLFNGCSQEDRFSFNSQVSYNLPTSPQEVIDACAKYPMQKDVQAIVFPAATAQCQWGVNGNLPFPDIDDVITARVEQNASLEFPTKAVICGIDFDFPTDPKNRTIRYDDEILLTFNGVVLASSYDYSYLFAKSGSDLSLYDFSKLAGQHYVQSDGKHPYCLGGDCVVPMTQTTGVWGLSIADALTAQLSADAIKKSSFNFSLITIGDNNPSTDCMQTGLQFNVHRRYVIIP